MNKNEMSVLKEAMNIVLKHLTTGEEVVIPKFGKFAVREVNYFDPKSSKTKTTSTLRFYAYSATKLAIRKIGSPTVQPTKVKPPPKKEKPAPSVKAKKPKEVAAPKPSEAPAATKSGFSFSLGGK